MNNQWEFDAMLYVNRGGHWIDFPTSVEKELSTRKSVRVFAWFDGHRHRTSLAPKGDGSHWIHVRKEIREAIGKTDGDMVHVRIARDTESRDPVMPEDLKWLLENEPDMKAVFNKQSASTKRYLIESVTMAKTDKTRVTNINKVFKFLHQQKNIS